MSEAPWRPKNSVVRSGEIANFAAAHRVLVLHCGAGWNAHDATMEARLLEVKAGLGEQVATYALDMDDRDNWDLFRKHNIVTVPTLLCFVDGRFHEMLVGLRPTEALRDRLRSWIASAGPAPTD